MLKKIEVDVSKETYEFMDGLSQFVGAMKKSLSDGWQPGSDIPALISAAITNLVPAFEGMDKIKTELAEDKSSFIKGLAIGSALIYEQVTK